MEVMLKKMRADWPVVAAAKRRAGVWTAADETEINLGIKALVEAKDIEMLTLWANWLEAEAKLAGKPSSDARQPSGCSWCKHLRKPGLSDGYCTERNDLPRAYGDDHPFRTLPADQGRSCAVFEFGSAR